MIKHGNKTLKGDSMTAKSYLFSGAAAFALLLAGCDAVRTPTDTEAAAPDAAASDVPVVDEVALANNPLLQDWDTPYGVPPFAEISDDDYMPAIDVAIAELEAEIEAIASNQDAPTF